MPVGPLLAAAVAMAAPCTTWSDCPVAAHLHEVHWSLLTAYQAQVERVMAGRDASPLFSEPLNEAEAHWRLLAATGRGLDLPTPRAQEWQDLGLAGSFLAMDRLFGEVADRSEEVASLREAFDTVLSPSATLILPSDGKPARFAHDTGWGVKRRFERSEEELGLDDEEAPRHGRKRPPARVSAGVGWKLRDPEAPPAAPLLTWNANVSVRNLGITLWRADVDLVHLHWDTLARQDLIEDVSVGAALHSGEMGPKPDRWSVGLYWIPERHYVVSALRTASLLDESWRYELTMRVELGTFLPGRLRPSLAGLPAVVDQSPNRLISPIARPRL